MLLSLKHSAGFWFYALALIMLAGLILVKRQMLLFTLPPILHSLDLPLILAGLLYGGTGLYLSLSRGKTSVILGAVIALVLLLLFGLVVYLNFAFAPQALIAG